MPTLYLTSASNTGIDPSSQIQIKSVQKFALLICSHEWNLDYHTLLHSFGLPPLSSRRDYLRLLTLYKIIFQYFHFPPILTPANVSCSTRYTTSDSNIYVVPFARTSSFKLSFILLEH